MKFPVTVLWDDGDETEYSACGTWHLSKLEQDILNTAFFDPDNVIMPKSIVDAEGTQYNCQWNLSLEKI